MKSRTIACALALLALAAIYRVLPEPVRAKQESPEPTPSVTYTPAPSPPPASPEPPVDISEIVERAPAPGQAVIPEQDPYRGLLAELGLAEGDEAALEKLAEALSLDWVPEGEPARLYEYIKNNPQLTASQAAVGIVSGRDRPFYTNVTVVDNPDDILVLCNKYNSLDSKYKPSGLTGIGGGYMLSKEAADGFARMTADMKRDKLYLNIRSAYRSYAYQLLIHAMYRESDPQKADTYSAKAGYSEHQTGLAVDIVQGSYYGSGMAAAEFEKTKQYAWLSENAHMYGFIERYPKGWEWLTGYKAEPWHWRYVGAEAATYMYENGIVTFEEYIAVVG